MTVNASVPGLPLKHPGMTCLPVRETGGEGESMLCVFHVLCLAEASVGTYPHVYMHVVCEYSCLYVHVSR